MRLFFAQHGLGVAAIGVVKAVIPASGGGFRSPAGPFSDRIGRKGLVATEWSLQAGGIWLTVLVPTYPAWIAAPCSRGSAPRWSIQRCSR